MLTPVDLDDFILDENEDLDVVGEEKSKESFSDKSEVTGSVAANQMPKSFDEAHPIDPSQSGISQSLTSGRESPVKCNASKKESDDSQPADVKQSPTGKSSGTGMTVRLPGTAKAEVMKQIAVTAKDKRKMEQDEEPASCCEETEAAIRDAEKDSEETAIRGLSNKNVEKDERKDKVRMYLLLTSNNCSNVAHSEHLQNIQQLVS